MNETRLEWLCERAEAGLATAEELAELEAWGMEESPLGELLREALFDEAGEPSLAEAIMSALPHADLELSAFADGQLEAEAAQRVAARVRAEPAAAATVGAFAQVSAGLTAALAEERGLAPDVWPGVARQLGWDPELVPGWDGQVLREAVLAEAGSVNVAPAVLDAIRPRAAAPVADEPVSAWRRFWAGFALPSFGFATAAALLAVLPTAPPAGTVALNVDVSPVNHVQIEEISSDAPDAVVSVMQFDEDSPTIIFIDEVPAEDEGATL